METEGQTSSRRSQSGPTTRVWTAIFVVCVTLTVYHLLLRPWHRTWGASEDEVGRQLPGDEMVPEPSDEITRAVTVEASSEEVWSWVVQLGQGRGGFYSYTWLENVAGADIQNVDRIVPELQELEEGDSIRMVREDYWFQSPITSMTVEYIDRGRTLVLQGHDGGTWTFHLDPMDEATTRLIVRGRKPEARTAVGYVVRYLTYELPHFIMERGMMLGIKRRAERKRRHDNNP